VAKKSGIKAAAYRNQSEITKSAAAINVAKSSAKKKKNKEENSKR